MARFLVLFLVIQAVLFGAQLTPWGQDYFVTPWTNGLAHFCAQLVAIVDPSAIATGKILRSATNGFAVSIEAGCNGVEATLVLIAAILAFPSTWKQKLWGLGLGFLAVQGLNVVRIISLFTLGNGTRPRSNGPISTFGRRSSCSTCSSCGWSGCGESIAIAGVCCRHRTMRVRPVRPKPPPPRP